MSGIARRANRLRRCAIAHQHARSLCTATGTVAPPFIDGRKSVASRAHTNMRATTEGVEMLRSGNSLPRRAIALGHSPRPCAGSRTHRRPRISMVQNRSRRVPTPICVQRPRGPKSSDPATCLPRRAMALGYSPTACAGSRKHRRPRFAMVENRSRHAPTPILMRATTEGGLNPKVG